MAYTFEIRPLAAMGETLRDKKIHCFAQIHPRSTLYPPGKIRFWFIIFQNFTGNLKNMKKLLFFLLVLGAVQVKAQVIKGSMDMRDSTFNRSIPFEVTPETKSVKYLIKVYAALGEVTVTFTDPNDKRSGLNVTLGTQTRGGGHEPSKGELSDDLNPKIPGTWKFNIRAENATGSVSYKIEIIKP